MLLEWWLGVSKFVSVEPGLLQLCENYITLQIFNVAWVKTARSSGLFLGHCILVAGTGSLSDHSYYVTVSARFFQGIENQILCS